MNYRTIHTCESALGGFEFRVTSNGLRVNVQERSPQAQTFRTVITLSAAEWETEVATRDLDSPYGGRSPCRIRDMIDDHNDAI